MNIERARRYGLAVSLAVFLSNCAAAAITPWLLLTPDIQVVGGAQKEKITIGRNLLRLPFIVSRMSIGTATILGFRMQTVF